MALPPFQLLSLLVLQLDMEATLMSQCCCFAAFMVAAQLGALLEAVKKRPPPRTLVGLSVAAPEKAAQRTLTSLLSK